MRDAYYIPVGTLLRRCTVLTKRRRRIDGVFNWKIRPSGWTKGFVYIPEDRVFSPDEVEGLGGGDVKRPKLKNVSRETLQRDTQYNGT